ncbi:MULTISPECIES: hypothetical protein [Niastella]|uniref:Late control protein n=1 Tax=Niastella soli TaxID=2821487 RepID=A0ABS3YRU6_9BACT|nr:hypothetical protein [Niastella soli]MBO9200583.1 hypothetical protein [Niastella soli]
MTSNVTVEGIKNIIKPNGISWKRSVTDYSDTATIKLPAVAMLKKEGGEYERIETGIKFQEGKKITIACGYDGKNPVQFKGFISQIKPNIPLEIECEGYSYQLRKKQAFNKSYRAGTNMKKVLTDLIDGTDITLSKAIPDVIIQSPVQFSGKTAIQVLDWFKEQMLMTVYFNFQELYVGLKYTNFKNTIKLRLGWNVVEDNDLKFNPNKNLSNVKVALSTKQKDGKTQYADPKSKGNDSKQIKMKVRLDPDTLKKIQEDQKRKLMNRGYEGSLTSFLVPFAEPAMAVEIDDPKYPARAGKYFIEAVEGEFGSGGGRQKIKIEASL